MAKPRRVANPLSPTEAARRGKTQQAVMIPANTTDVALAIKRFVWLSQGTLTELAARLGMNLHYLERVLGAQTRKQTQRLHPSLLNRICEALYVEPEVRAHWHILGARAHGWEIPLEPPDLSKLERDERYTALRRVGCLCCLLNQRRGLLAVPLNGFRQRVEIHHLNEGGQPGSKRRGDRYTVPLCSWHHRGEGNLDGALYGPTWVGGSKPFRAVYGLDDELLAMADEAIGWGQDGGRDFSEDPF